MFKNRILKKIGAGLLAGLCAFSMLGTTIGNSGITASAASAQESLIDGSEVIKQAATYLGAPYGWDNKGYSGVYSSNGPTKLPLQTVMQNGLDCSGLVYATLADLGVRTTGFGANNPVPINTYNWVKDANGNAYSNCTITYKGVTSNVEVLFDALDADEHEYYEPGNLVAGSVVVGMAKGSGVDHMWIYMGQFDSRNAVLDYLVTLGFNRNSVSPYVGSGNGDGGKHWRIESNGSQGVVINNNTDGKARFASYTAFKITKNDVTFSIKKVLKEDNTIVISGTSKVDGSVCKYGVYSDKSCTKKVGEITIGTNGQGSIQLPNSQYYVKEIHAPTGYSLSAEVYTLKAGQTVFVEEDFTRGAIKINKTSEDQLNENREFKITFSINGKAYSKTAKTNATGLAEFKNLQAYDMSTGKPITYTVEEINVDGRYIVPAKKTVTLINGDVNLTSSLKFYNELKKGSIKINKQSEDGENGGRTFEISGNGKTYTINTNDDGVAILSDIPVYDSDNNKIVYTISEKNVPIKYVVPADQTATLTADGTVNKTFKNILKKFTVEVTKQDAENGSAQGNASLAGAVYGIYNNGDLIDTYTTDSNGRFTTKEYLCDDNWTIQEITPSEGYLLDETVYTVGAESKNYTVERNTLEMTVYEEIIKGSVSIIKHSDDGDTQIETPEEGAEFQIYLKSSGSYDNAKDFEKDYLVCDENGFAQSKDLPYGIYVVHQTVGWEGKEFIADFEVNISEHGKTYHYLINNATMKSLVRIVKKDAETGNIIPVSGIGFKVWDCSAGEFISQTINYPTPMSINEFYTDENGSLMLPQELVYGNYELHEIQTADGYYLGTEVIPFSVDGSEEIITVEKFNVAQKGRISVVKTGDAFSSVAMASSSFVDEDGNMIENPTTYTPIFKEKGLAGAVYQIIASEDIITADGTVRANAGDILAELTTDENGYATSDLLYLGKYEIKEITAPYGYVLNAESQFTELTYAGQEIEVCDTVEKAFVNEYQGVEISLEKWLETDEIFGTGSGLEYTNIRFGLFADEEIIAADGTIIPQDGLISEVSLDEDMTAKFTEKIPFGRYYVQEISTDEHYVLNGEKYLVNFEYMGQECTTVYFSANDGVSIKNFIGRGSIEGKKVSEDDVPLENAVFGLFSVETTEFTTENAFMTAKSDEMGCFSFADVPFGIYAIREIEAPTGYVLSDEIFAIEIAEDGEIIKIEAVNRIILGSVHVTKIDEEYPDNRLSGAEFTVYADEACETEIGKLTEVEKGEYLLGGLEFGKYYLKETVAPDGFVLDENVYAFEIIEDGVTVEVSNTEAGNGFINKPITGTIEITKKDISDGRLIPDCGIEILDKDGNVIFQGRTDENGIVTFEKLRYGDYFYREFDAPEGYLIDETSYPFSICEDGEIIKCEITNEKIPEKPKTPEEPNYPNDNSPKTGVSSPVIKYLIGAGISLIVAIFMIKKKKTETMEG